MIGSLIMRHWRQTKGKYPSRIFLSALALRTFGHGHTRFDFFGIPLVIDQKLKGIAAYCAAESASAPISWLDNNGGDI